MGLLDRINYKGFLLRNAEPHAIEEVGIETDDTKTTDTDSVNLVDVVPFKVKRTIKNCRFAANDPIVKGILNDNITKTLSNFVIEGDNDEAVEYIKNGVKVMIGILSRSCVTCYGVGRWMVKYFSTKS